MISLILKKKYVNVNETQSQTEDDWELMKLFISFPLISLFCCITNGLNIAVFLHSKMKDESFKYLLAKSISNFLYSILMIYSMILYCEECSINKTYASQLYRIMINYYITSCLAIFGHLCEIYVSVYHLLKLTNSSLHSLIPYKINFIVFFVLSVLIYLDELFLYDIMQTKVFLNQTQVYWNQSQAYLNQSQIYLNQNQINVIYSTEKTAFAKSTLGKLLPSIQAMLRVFITTILITILNVLIVYHFHKRFNKRVKIKLKYINTLSKLSLKLNCSVGEVVHTIK